MQDDFMFQGITGEKHVTIILFNTLLLRLKLKDSIKRKICTVPQILKVRILNLTVLIF